jgi:trimethylamine:corrinoid methyltransferase-like protein
MMRNFNRVRKGVTVTKETLAVDVMKEVGIRGFYLDREDTLAWIKESDEFLHKEMFDVSSESSPYEDPVVRAHAKWKEILAEHKPDVSEEDKAAIDAIVEKHTKEILASLET